MLVLYCPVSTWETSHSSDMEGARFDQEVRNFLPQAHHPFSVENVSIRAMPKRPGDVLFYVWIIVKDSAH